MGYNTKALKNRIRSVNSTLHLTRAMGLVASSKMRRANESMNSGRQYAAAFGSVMDLLTACPDCIHSPYMRPTESKRVCLVVIAGDRGLAGGYNGNILRMAYREMQNTDAEVLPIGKKAVEFFRMRGVPLVTEQYAELLQRFEQGYYDDEDVKKLEEALASMRR